MIRFERCLEGYIIWNEFAPGDPRALKIGVVSTKHDQGLRREGRVIYEVQARQDWGLYFTSATMSLGLLEEIMKALPTEA